MRATIDENDCFSTFCIVRVIECQGADLKNNTITIDIVNGITLKAVLQIRMSKVNKKYYDKAWGLRISTFPCFLCKASVDEVSK